MFAAWTVASLPVNGPASAGGAGAAQAAASRATTTGSRRTFMAIDDDAGTRGVKRDRATATIPAMSASRAWDRAGSLPVPIAGRRLPEVAALREELPAVDELFTFMRDAELRFATLRMRIEERTWTARGEELLIHEVSLRHPGEAKVL